MAWEQLLTQHQQEILQALKDKFLDHINFNALLKRERLAIHDDPTRRLNSQYNQHEIDLMHGISSKKLTFDEAWKQLQRGERLQDKTNLTRPKKWKALECPTTKKKKMIACQNGCWREIMPEEEYLDRFMRTGVSYYSAAPFTVDDVKGTHPTVVVNTVAQKLREQKGDSGFAFIFRAATFNLLKPSKVSANAAATASATQTTVATGSQEASTAAPFLEARAAPAKVSATVSATQTTVATASQEASTVAPSLEARVAPALEVCAESDNDDNQAFPVAPSATASTRASSTEGEEEEEVLVVDMSSTSGLNKLPEVQGTRQLSVANQDPNQQSTQLANAHLLGQLLNNTNNPNITVNLVQGVSGNFVAGDVVSGKSTKYSGNAVGSDQDPGSRPATKDDIDKMNRNLGHKVDENNAILRTSVKAPNPRHGARYETPDDRARPKPRGGAPYETPTHRVRADLNDRFDSPGVDEETEASNFSVDEATTAVPPSKRGEVEEEEMAGTAPEEPSFNSVEQTPKPGSEPVVLEQPIKAAVLLSQYLKAMAMARPDPAHPEKILERPAEALAEISRKHAQVRSFLLPAPELEDDMERLVSVPTTGNPVLQHMLRFESAFTKMNQKKAFLREHNAWPHSNYWAREGILDQVRVLIAEEDGWSTTEPQKRSVLALSRKKEFSSLVCNMTAALLDLGKDIEDLQEKIKKGQGDRNYLQQKLDWKQERQLAVKGLNCEERLGLQKKEDEFLHSLFYYVKEVSRSSEFLFDTLRTCQQSRLEQEQLDPLSWKGILDVLYTFPVVDVKGNEDSDSEGDDKVDMTPVLLFVRQPKSNKTKSKESESKETKSNETKSNETKSNEEERDVVVAVFGDDDENEPIDTDIDQFLLPICGFGNVIRVLVGEKGVNIAWRDGDHTFANSVFNSIFHKAKDAVGKKGRVEVDCGSGSYVGPLLFTPKELSSLQLDKNVVMEINRADIGEEHQKGLVGAAHKVRLTNCRLAAGGLVLAKAMCDESHLKTLILTDDCPFDTAALNHLFESLNDAMDPTTLVLKASAAARFMDPKNEACKVAACRFQEKMITELSTNVRTLYVVAMDMRSCEDGHNRAVQHFILDAFEKHIEDHKNKDQGLADVQEWIQHAELPFSFRDHKARVVLFEFLQLAIQHKFVAEPSRKVPDTTPTTTASPTLGGAVARAPAESKCVSNWDGVFPKPKTQTWKCPECMLPVPESETNCRVCKTARVSNNNNNNNNNNNSETVASDEVGALGGDVGGTTPASATGGFSFNFGTAIASATEPFSSGGATVETGAPATGGFYYDAGTASATTASATEASSLPVPAPPEGPGVSLEQSHENGGQHEPALVEEVPIEDSTGGIVVAVVPKLRNDEADVVHNAEGITIVRLVNGMLRYYKGTHPMFEGKAPTSGANEWCGTCKNACANSKEKACYHHV